MDHTRKITVTWNEIFFFFIAVLFFTVFRVALLLIYPIIVLAFFYVLKWKMSYQGLLLIGVMLLFWIFSFRDGVFLKYNLVSLYYFIPFVLLLFAVPGPAFSRRSLLTALMVVLTAVGIINNIVGIIQYSLNPGDDNFLGIYGQFTVSQNGLSLLNGLLSFYYFILFQQTKKRLHLIGSLFFIICCVMGFYGAGMMALLVSLVLYYFRFSFTNIFRLIVITAVVVSLVYLLMYWISPNTLEYNINILKKFWTASRESAPRKLVIVFNYLDAYLSHIVDFLFGSGPGTFNSRSAFMVGSPTYFNLDLIKSDAKPAYFISYAYTLWNPSNTGPYDGFMNQPFSSLLALLGEYGFIFTSLLAIFLLRSYRYYKSLGRNQGQSAIANKMYRFVTIYLIVLIIIDNYIEYPEVTALLILIMKLCETEIKTKASGAIASIQPQPQPVLSH
jgi:hypothetical protein